MANAEKNYMVVQRWQDYMLIKVGHASDLDRRMKEYRTTAGPTQLLGYVETYKKTGHQLERNAHREMAKMGLRQFSATGNWSEWYMVDYTSPLFEEIMTNGLAVFKCFKGRKVYAE